MKPNSIFSNLLQNIIALYRGRNLLWQILFCIATYVLVVSGFDYFYFQSTRNETLVFISFSAALFGFLIPVFLPLGMYVYSRIKKSELIKNATYAIIQAGVLGLAVSSFYKVFTGRVGPMHTAITTDITHMFRFGILKGGAFQGWPSSHTSVAFAISMALVTLFPKNKLVKYSAIIYAIYIGLGVSTTIHWFSDFVAGAILGTIIGITVGKSFLKLYIEKRDK
jgi:membrane-associated phospholipid phosphatase